LRRRTGSASQPSPEKSLQRPFWKMNGGILIKGGSESAKKTAKGFTTFYFESTIGNPYYDSD
jgi:hypothetical protein